MLNKKLILILLIIITASCNNKEKIIADNFKSSWQDYYIKDYDRTSQIDVLVVTNRKNKKGKFSCQKNAFNDELVKKVEFGVCKINVPKNHNIGEIPQIITDNGLIHKDFKILTEKPLTNDEFIKKIKDLNRRPLIFVHGFNVFFNEASVRAAQIAYDLKYQGPIILFSWPSGGDSSSIAMINKTYKNNLDNVLASINQFSEFLTILKNNEITPNILVHSMGHVMVLNSLDLLANKYPQTKFVNRLILNAPDFDQSRFNEIKDNLKNSAKKITIYCAKNDKAILASKILNKESRVGECIVIDPKKDKNIDLVDVTLVNDSLLGHSYYASREVLIDIFQDLIGIEAKKRIFISKKDFYEKQYFMRK